MPLEEPPAARGQSQSEPQARLSSQAPPSTQPGPAVSVGLEAGGGAAPSTASATNVDDGLKHDGGINETSSDAQKGPAQVLGVVSLSKVGSNASSPVVQNDPEMVARIRQRLSGNQGARV